MFPDFQRLYTKQARFSWPLCARVPGGLIRRAGLRFTRPSWEWLTESLNVFATEQRKLSEPVGVRGRGPTGIKGRHSSRLFINFRVCLAACVSALVHQYNARDLYHPDPSLRCAWAYWLCPVKGLLFGSFKAERTPAFSLTLCGIHNIWLPVSGLHNPTARTMFDDRLVM